MVCACVPLCLCVWRCVVADPGGDIRVLMWWSSRKPTWTQALQIPHQHACVCITLPCWTHRLDKAPGFCLQQETEKTEAPKALLEDSFATCQWSSYWWGTNHCRWRRRGKAQSKSKLNELNFLGKTKQIRIFWYHSADCYLTQTQVGSCFIIIGWLKKCGMWFFLWLLKRGMSERFGEPLNFNNTYAVLNYRC